MSQNSNESVERAPAQRLMFGAMPASRDLRIVGNGVEMDHSLRARNVGLDVTPRAVAVAQPDSHRSQYPHREEVKQLRGHTGLDPAAQQFFPRPVQTPHAGTPLNGRRDLDHNAAPSQHVINGGYRGTDPRRMPRPYPAHALSTSAETIQDRIDRLLGVEATRDHTTPMPPTLKGNMRGPRYGDLVSHSLNHSPPLSAVHKAAQEQEKRVRKSEKRREKRMKRREKRGKEKQDDEVEQENEGKGDEVKGG
ncbi:hypothetical protein AUEXF2481DRAFT_32030 [Aureobasidium subglaciale EXF-2481]|uniref:Pal1-domain-containing protein n=1 Tax=Aureobasidium subglaciale (strain EXF-2481) TaxID=1043005 RepID=A0A074Y3X9_AURSE|nr:uncharacterized protein AUEXF2481DRAFT_32030 [Aureobasidium subglaciale EXF-2481]KAI5210776.1 hypothetical protein E4T38_01842 [Aureobasidium subglaciale]KAI5229234.1 hypothetical protein E4T40_01637 [Aureobasidium subglaciale]KAI5232979.1 hypothetical protein E4T41_01840 [Aureobasidium subglaciale]KAI5266262.1 hypothetical protein E4T46_01634 [Aureobasidium subglaciale]KEQ92430.1 hypothetical protein AUEXF2481DRAFT_32030 [Aureobasidium subglaciale EXF-2481]